jgi:hypothetical protein
LKVTYTEEAIADIAEPLVSRRIITPRAASPSAGASRNRNVLNFESSRYM